MTSKRLTDEKQTNEVTVTDALAQELAELEKKLKNPKLAEQFKLMLSRSVKQVC